jgi:kynurenine formamidase
MALPQHLEDLAAQVSNWGRWGADDRRGTLNLIDHAAVSRGLAAARQGRVFSLAIPFDQHGPQMGFIPGRSNPTLTAHMVNASISGDPSDFCSSDDSVTMGTQSATHWDGLGHVGYNGLLYPGVADTANTEQGSTEHGIEHFGPVVSRGILLDMARVVGRDPLEAGYAYTPADLDAAVALAGVTVQPGDIVCLRSGFIQHFFAGERMRYATGAAGPSTQSIHWFRDHDVAAVAADTLIFEVFPCEDPATMLPVHMIHIRDMGLVQGQNFDFEALAADCAADGQYEFLLSATPLPITGSSGGAIAPVAVK